MFNSQRFIQHIVTTPEAGTTIICIYKQQAEIFLDYQDFEVDMSFKRVLDAGAFKEIIFARHITAQGKSILQRNLNQWSRTDHRLVMTFGRAFIDFKSEIAFKQMFKAFFSSVERLTGRQLLWKHLHSTGIRAAVMDMDAAQINGKVM